MTGSMAEFAEGVVNDFQKSGELRPRIYVITTDGLFFHFDYTGETREKVEESQQVILKIVIAARVAGVLSGTAMIGEAWTSHEAVDAPRRYARPELDPERGECVFYVAYEPDGRKTFKSWEIKRDGKAVSLTKIIDAAEYVGKGKHHSWMDRAFVELGPLSPAIVTGARDMLDRLKSKRPGREV